MVEGASIIRYRRVMARMLAFFVVLAMTGQAAAFESTHDKTRALQIISRISDPAVRMELRQNALLGNFDTLEDLREAAGLYRDRVILVGHPYGAEAGVSGTEIRSLVLPVGGKIIDRGMRLDVGVRPARIGFLPSGRFALVLGEKGTLLSVAAETADSLRIVDTVTFPHPGNLDLIIDPNGGCAYVVVLKIDGQGGVYTVRVAGDGTLSVEDNHFPLRLASAMALFPDDSRRAVVLGGQTSFEPLDGRDLRILELGPDGWYQVGAFDIFVDYVDCLGIAISGDGGTVLVPNGAIYSEEGGQMAVVDIKGDTLTESDRLTDLPDMRQARFAPDGRTALVSRFEPGYITVLLLTDGRLELVDELRVPLVNHMVLIRRGPDTGKVVVPSIHPSGGPELVLLQVKAPGKVTKLQRLFLGSGYVNIPGAIGISP